MKRDDEQNVGLVPTNTSIIMVLLALGFGSRDYMWSLLICGMGKSISLTVIGGTGIGLLLQPMLLVLQTAIQPCNMAMVTTLFIAIHMLSSSIGLAVFHMVQHIKLGSIFSKLMLQYPQYADVIAKAVTNQAVIHTSSTLLKPN
ncbi:hypothetical protein GGI24_003173 [Coemansia furcata]|nr:hypothetical protein GGI24_003173 [Coemansia furcata]